MSKNAKIFWTGLGIIVAFVLIIWFFSKVLEILKENPQPLWFILGILATLVVEFLVYLGVIIKRRYWR
jgi:membrane protein YdbS with pleckstrin-like domain